MIRCPNCEKVNKFNNKLTCMDCGYDLLEQYQHKNIVIKLRFNHKGFISTFLSILLMFGMIICMISIPEINNSKNEITEHIESLSALILDNEYGSTILNTQEIEEFKREMEEAERQLNKTTIEQFVTVGSIAPLGLSSCLCLAAGNRKSKPEKQEMLI